MAGLRTVHRARGFIFTAFGHTEDLEADIQNTLRNIPLGGLYLPPFPSHESQRNL